MFKKKTSFKTKVFKHATMTILNIIFVINNLNVKLKKKNIKKQLDKLILNFDIQEQLYQNPKN